MVLPKRLLIPALALGLAGCVLNADAPLASRATRAVDLVPADARMIAFTDGSAITGNLDLLSDLDDSGDFDEGWAQIEEVLERAGMDLRQDLDFVVAYAAPDLEPVVTAVGRFDVNAIAGVIADEMPEARRLEGDGLTAWTLGHMAVAVSEDGTRAMAGRDVAALEAALESGGGAQIAELGGPALQAESWMILRDVQSLRNEGGEIPQREMDLLSRAIAHLALGGTVSSQEAAGMVVLHPAEGVEAEDLAALVRGVVAALELQEEMPAEVRERLETVEVDRDGDLVVVTGSVSRNVIESFIR